MGSDHIQDVHGSARTHAVDSHWAPKSHGRVEIHTGGQGQSKDWVEEVTQQVDRRGVDDVNGSPTEDSGSGQAHGTGKVHGLGGADGEGAGNRHSLSNRDSLGDRNSRTDLRVTCDD